jgi:cyclophilin family peptidyl-prolyl cis-trans isomerase
VKSFTSLLGSTTESQHWHLAARALVKLTEFQPEDAVRILDGFAMTHNDWHVRVAAVETAGKLLSQDRLQTLADDLEPNVRARALDELRRLHSPASRPLALKALEADDYHLVLTAARVLRDTPPAARVEAANALVTALKRLSDPKKDTSRPPRLEMLLRLKEFGAPDDTGLSPLLPLRSDLVEFLKDIDPLVAAATADALAVITGVRPEAKPTYRPPAQPTETDLVEVQNLRPTFTVIDHGENLLADAILQFDTGDSIALSFGGGQDAPIAVARFLALARDGYFNEQLVYQLVPEGWMSMGSPGANEDSADARFLRDERSTRDSSSGAVGLLNHGLDTNDGRFFIALGELAPFEQTIFAHVVGSVPILLEGTKIVRVQVPPKPTR